MQQTEEILYPDSDGLPIAENTIQFRWIAIVMWNAASLFHERADVFVAGDHLIYPVEGKPEIRSAPDAYVAFGVPNRDRGSYKVWQEGGIFPQVVFEVWSPGNRKADFDAKLAFYEKYGAEEYYLIDPEGREEIYGWRRDEGVLAKIPNMEGYVSPRLGFRFHTSDGSIGIDGPDGKPLIDPKEAFKQRDAAELRADEERFHADLARNRADSERAAKEAERNAKDAERAAKEAALAEAEKFRTKLRELGIDPDSI